MDISIVSILARTITNSTPIVLAGVGGIFAEKSGIVNISIEGVMLSGAFAAAAGAFVSGSPWLGLLAGVAAATLVSLLHAYLCISAKINHVVSGLAINIFASSMTVYMMSLVFDSKGSSPQVDRIPFINFKFLSSIPGLREIFGNISIVTLLAIVVVAVISFLLYKTPFGIHVIAAGQNPKAAEVLGISVVRTQYISVMISGICSGLAGLFLSISFMNAFSKDMVAGRGFIAIATIIFGRYNPIGVACAGLLFGFLDAVQMSLQGTIEIPREFVQSIPYIVTIIAVATISSKKFTEI